MDITRFMALVGPRVKTKFVSYQLVTTPKWIPDLKYVRTTDYYYYYHPIDTSYNFHLPCNTNNIILLGKLNHYSFSKSLTLSFARANLHTPETTDICIMYYSLHKHDILIYAISNRNKACDKLNANAIVFIEGKYGVKYGVRSELYCINNNNHMV